MPDKILQTPKNPPPTNGQDAYVQALANLSIAITALVDRMGDIAEELAGIGAEAAIVSKYCERKGDQEGIWTPEDKKEMEEPEAPDPDA